MVTSKKKVAKREDETIKVETPKKLLDESRPPADEKGWDKVNVENTQTLIPRVQVLEDAIKAHRVMSHRTGARQHDHVLYKVLGE